MALDRIVIDTSAGTLVGGLKWAVPTGKPGRSALSELKALHEATHSLLVQGSNGAAYGLFGLRIGEEGERLPKTIVSAAAAFAERVGRQSPDAALVLRLPDAIDASDQGIERTYVVVLNEGVPVVDEIVDRDKAASLVGNRASVWSDDDVSYPRAESVDLDWLAQGAGKSTRVTPIPANPLPLILVAVSVLVVVGSMHAYKLHRKAAEQRLLAAQAAAADPVPKYLAALTAQKGQMAFSRSDLAGMGRSLFQLPIRVPGWKLQGAECVAVAQSCVAQWRRQGGTYDDLKRAAPGQSLVYVSSAGSGFSDLEIAQTRIESKAQRGSLLENAPFPTVVQTQDRFGSQFQVWKTAKLSPEFRPHRLWPTVPDVPANFVHPQALHAGEFAVREVPGPFLQEVLQTAPPNIAWEKLKLIVEDNPDPRHRLKFELTGTYYVSYPSP